MKILFVLAYPGFLRFYAETIEELVARGNRVVLAFDRPLIQGDSLSLLARADGIEVVGSAPRRRKDEWAGCARAVRSALDYVRYLHPRYRDAPFLRNRRRKSLARAGRLVWLGRFSSWPAPLVRVAMVTFRAAERAIPADPRYVRFLREVHPDVLVVSPLVSAASPQTDAVKAAQHLGIPCAAAIASWDNLTNKGDLRVRPDRLLVWNEAQREEARALHGYPKDRVRVTGAQHFDFWFRGDDRRDRAAFCETVGLDPTRPYVLFLSSTGGIAAAASEQQFVSRWLEAIRSSSDPLVSELQVLIRPHPLRAHYWRGQEVAERSGVGVWPSGDDVSAFGADARVEFHDSVAHAACVVGINSTAMIESAILRKSVLTVLDPVFAATQRGTLHFRYMVRSEGGFLLEAADLGQHCQQLAAVLRCPQGQDAVLAQFVERFVRPRGLARPVVPILADEIEALQGLPPQPGGRVRACTAAVVRVVLRRLAPLVLTPPR